MDSRFAFKVQIFSLVNLRATRDRSRGWTSAHHQ